MVRGGGGRGGGKEDRLDSVGVDEGEQGVDQLPSFFLFSSRLLAVRFEST